MPGGGARRKTAGAGKIIFSPSAQYLRGAGILRELDAKPRKRPGKADFWHPSVSANTQYNMKLFQLISQDTARETHYGSHFRLAPNNRFRISQAFNCPSEVDMWKRRLVQAYVQRRLDPLRRRTRQGDGRRGRLREPGRPAVRGDRRAGQRSPVRSFEGAMVRLDRYVKVRRNHRIVSVVAIVAVGANHLSET